MYDRRGEGRGLVADIAAIAGLVLLAGLVAFQIGLIAGRPWGRMAWGGSHEVLPRNLRIASISSIVLYVLFATAIAEKSGLISLGLPESSVGLTMWLLSGYFLLGVFMNAISRSKQERMVMTPVAFMLFVCFVAVALR